MSIPLKAETALENRDALAKALYTKMFDHLIGSLNTCLHTSADSKTFVGLLDIYGFENFAQNR